MSYLKKYEYVITIAKKGGISQAAEELNMSQPTLSKYIKKIESELGVELFDRSTIPLKLTSAGESFVSAGRQFIDMEHQLQKQIQEIKLNKNTEINIGISPSRAPYLLPSVIALYRKRNPSARITVKERTTSELVSMLRSGELDLVISLLDDESAHFERIELFDEEILLAVPKSLCNDDATSTDILLSCTLVQIGEGLTLSETMNEITAALGVSAPEIECQSIESALSLVKHGIGATIVPSYVKIYGKTEQNKNIIFLPLPIKQFPEWKEFYSRKVCLFYRKEQFLTESEKDFIDCVKKLTAET